MINLLELKDKWQKKIKRSTELIVPKVTYTNGEGSLNNEKWKYYVPYAFRDSLDIKFEERKKDGKSYMVWTQGAILSFKRGDMLHSMDETSTLQVKYASPMGWNTIKDSMYAGSVTYTEYNNTSNSSVDSKTVSQFEFLEILMYGKYGISTKKDLE